MKIILFGATGMVGQGVLRECLNDPSVTNVLSVGRSPLDIEHPKLRNLVLKDLLNYQAVEGELSGYDACFFCLGATAAGKTEQEYALVNHAIPVAVGETLARIRPGMTFIYISGAGTDSTEKGRTMWARVKGKTENALLAMSLSAYMFRPAAIQPMHGEVSKTLAYRIGIAILRPVFPIFRGLFPGFITTTERIGRAMLNIARSGYAERILESRSINVAA
jgi:uncharacterized protein YbjT (DUF2867 family)